MHHFVFIGQNSNDPAPALVTSRSGGGPRRACEDNSPRVGRLAKPDFTWEAHHHQRVGRGSVSPIHEAHEPSDPLIISVHAAWDVGGGGACTEMNGSNGARLIWYPGENVRIVPAPGNNCL